MNATRLPDWGPSERNDSSMEVARKLLSYVLSSDLKRGDRLPSERELANAAGLSRWVVREAVKALAFLGILVVRQGDGTYVADARSEVLQDVIEWSILLDDQTSHEVVEARAHIEVEVARLAASRRSDQHLADMRTQVDAMSRSLSERTAFGAADASFHELLAEAAGNRVYASMLTSVHALLRQRSRRTLEASVDLRPQRDEHAAVFQAVSKGDPDQAGAAMDRHMHNAAARFEAVLAADSLLAGPSVAGAPRVVHGGDPAANRDMPLLPP